ncbi:O-antigen ligase family protein [Sphingomonas sp. MMSM20]|nr:O-antigen ligase family protein [Sphingomonas lycopersici]
MLLGILWLCGGASRADAAGQIAVRGGAWFLLVAVILLGRRPALGEMKAVSGFLFAAVALVLLQLVPLPPMIWMALPGRAVFVEAARLIGQPQPWRPWTIVPGATVNAASSLIVPLVVLILIGASTWEERCRLPGALLVMIVLSMLIGLLQFSGGWFDNPFINDTPGQVSGTFANRNHFALFLAIGCVVSPVWAFLDGRRPRWRGLIALGLVPLFVLTLLASGSRAGLLLGVLALVMGLLLARRGLARELRRYPRWVLPAAVVGIGASIAILVLISAVTDRAASIDRLFLVDQGQDMRVRSLPVVSTMVRTYFPAGTGAGSFDPLFRMHEPFALLVPTYFNHAHNDFVEIVLDTGLPGLLLLTGALMWWGFTSIRVWRAEGLQPGLAGLGSAVLLLVLIASMFDYPARTPMIMAVVVLASVWLAGTPKKASVVTLPPGKQHL